MLVDIDLLLVDEVGAGGKSYANGALDGHLLYQAAVQCVYGYWLLSRCCDLNVSIATLQLGTVRHYGGNLGVKVEGEWFAVGVTADECGHM